MSKALQEKIEELFQATKDLMSLEEIKPHCDRFNEWLNEQNYSEATLGTKFSAYGFYKKFKNLDLKPGENAEVIAKHDAEGNVKGHELKHYVPLLCGLNKQQWDERNQSTRVIDRLENSTEIDPDSYLEVTGKLLASDDPHELAVGLIAATGRRPHEIIARAKFAAIKDKPYHVKFEGQGKKRGDKPVFEIATLFPADYVIKALARLRKESSTQSLLQEVAKGSPSITKQNIEIDNRRGQSLRRVVRTYFGDKGQKTPVLAFRYGDDQDNNKALRAAYAVLATERDCHGSYGAKILYASRILGHFTPQIQDDRVLGKLATSAGYSDYYVTKPVRFVEVDVEKLANVKASVSDLEKVKELQKLWGFPGQKEVVHRLLQSMDHIQSLERRLVESQQKIVHLQEVITVYEKQVVELQQQNQRLKEESQVMSQQPQITPVSEASTVESTGVPSESRIDKLEAQTARLEQMMQQMMEMMSSGAATATKPQEEVATVPQEKPETGRKLPEPKPEIDWGGISNEQLRNMKAPGAVEEKIYRAFRAIADYNDNAPSNNDRWYIGSVTLSSVSGCNRQAVGDWVKTHQLTVDDHNNKYALGQYHNKRHKGVEITDLVKLWE
ncbi:protelomerase family protein [Mastigocladopsis repens]|uniref:protelomerase family protein n=1 Tax=Mastigocladopsis repens TaxID=221287 RepID=UPI0002FD926A|nr:protelomerase family protein [Mastigocladopsis repens]